MLYQQNENIDAKQMNALHLPIWGMPYMKCMYGSLFANRKVKPNQLHRAATGFVSAKAQAAVTEGTYRSRFSNRRGNGDCQKRTQCEIWDHPEKYRCTDIQIQYSF